MSCQCPLPFPRACNNKDNALATLYHAAQRCPFKVQASRKNSTASWQRFQVPSRTYHPSLPTSKPTQLPTSKLFPTSQLPNCFKLPNFQAISNFQKLPTSKNRPNSQLPKKKTHLLHLQVDALGSSEATGWVTQAFPPGSGWQWPQGWQVVV